jgi:hypothetical protein
MTVSLVGVEFGARPIKIISGRKRSSLISI